jgi:hypothetical protein
MGDNKSLGWRFSFRKLAPCVSPSRRSSAIPSGGRERPRPNTAKSDDEIEGQGGCVHLPDMGRPLLLCLWAHRDSTHPEGGTR